MESSTATTRAAGAPAVQAPTVAQALRRTAERVPDRVAVRTKDDEVVLTWGELRDRVDAVAGGLAKLGVGRGGTVAIMLSNRPEFHVMDLAVTTLGGTPYSVYQTYTPDQIRYLLEDAGTTVAIVEQAFLPQVLEARQGAPGLEHVVVIDGDAPEGTIPLSEVEGADPGFDGEAAAAAVQPEDILTLIYTSGTTGPPKGVQLTHRNCWPRWRWSRS